MLSKKVRIKIPLGLGLESIRSSLHKTAALMPYPFTNKTIKFIRKLRHFSNYLEGLKLITVHKHIDQFYYMQKTEELKLLHQQLIEALTIADNIQFRLEGNYRKVYHQWRMDARWLNQHLCAGNKSQSVYSINSVTTNYRCNESS